VRQQHFNGIAPFCQRVHRIAALRVSGSPAASDVRLEGQAATEGRGAAVACGRSAARRFMAQRRRLAIIRQRRTAAETGIIAAYANIAIAVSVCRTCRDSGVKAAAKAAKLRAAAWKAKELSIKHQSVSWAKYHLPIAHQ
jgi:hypothetical protein